MDKTFFSSVLVIFFVVVLTQPLYAQTRIFGGISFPIGDFSSTDSAIGGFARLGFSVGAEITTKFYFGTEIGLSGIISYHPVNEIELLHSRPHIPFGSPIEAGPWILIWPMGNLGYSVPVSNSIEVYGRGHAGVLYGISPEITVVELGTKFTQNHSIKIVFGWGVGIGIFINKKLDVGIRFLTAKPEYDVNIQGGGTSITQKPVQDTRTLQLLIGINI